MRSPLQTKKGVNYTYRNVSKQLRKEAFLRLRAKHAEFVKVKSPNTASASSSDLPVNGGNSRVHCSGASGNRQSRRLVFVGSLSALTPECWLGRLL